VDRTAFGIIPAGRNTVRNATQNLRRVRRLRQTIVQTQPDAVVTSLTTTNILTLLALRCAIIEALACGLPVIATDCPGGTGEAIHDGENGLLVAPDDVEGLATAMARLMDDEAERRG
jgi:glycosyltransferase involved in cell wall biosynthesis